MEKLKVGILGLRRGITHLRNFLALEEAEVIAAADRLPACRERGMQVLADVKEKHPGRRFACEIVTEYDELLAMQPDAVVVASNGKMQVEHACQALKAGCHVFSEVPGAYTEAEWVPARRGAANRQELHAGGKHLLLGASATGASGWEERFGPIRCRGSICTTCRRCSRPPTARAFSTRQGGGPHRSEPIWRAVSRRSVHTHDLGPLLEVLDDAACR